MIRLCNHNKLGMWITRVAFRSLATVTQVGCKSSAVQLRPIATAFILRAMEDKESLKKRLTPLQYHITQEGGTERPFTGCFNKFYEEGLYVCVVCRQGLFSSKTKYDSGCGWPAFNDVLETEKVTLHKDTSAGMVRTEVRCSKCTAHLGHVFNDGPAPTKKRFCINSASIDFIPAEERTD